MAASWCSAPTIPPEVVKQRLAAYERATKPLTDYYRRQGVLAAWWTLRRAWTK